VGPEIWLYHYRARYYGPEVGRFISEDPIGLRGGVNPYAYAGGNPARFRDPLGLKVGGRLKDPASAAKDAMTELALSGADMRYEHGGRVCSDNGGFFCRPSRTQGSRTQVDGGSCPAGTRHEGRYHNHPRDDDLGTNDDFSEGDMEDSRREGKPTYLLNPNLDMLEFVWPGPSKPIGSVTPRP
jgi:uncharacterized protein RhaS with RHS repeats